MKRLRKREHSLVFWVNMMLSWLLVLFAGVVLLFSFVSDRLLTELMVANEQELLTQTARSMDLLLDGTERMLYQIFYSQEDIQLLETDDRETPRFMAKQNIANSLKEIIAWNTVAEFVFYYNPSTGPRRTFLKSTRGGADANVLDELQKAIEEHLIDPQNRTAREGFLTLTSSGAGYYIRYFKVSNSFTGMCMSTDALLGDLITKSAQSGSGVFLTDRVGTVYSGSNGFPDTVEMTADGQMIRLNGGEYMQLAELSGTGSFYLGSWLNMRYVSGRLRSVKLFAIGLVVLNILILIFFTIFLRRIFARPVRNMAQDMKRLGSGDWDLRAQGGGRIQEFNQLSDNFNDMVTEIRDLKISNYEKELDAQRADLQYLQLQSNPHFYLNVLNIIYSLAEVKDYEMIQKMTMALVDYSRYTFRDPRELVTVQGEIEHVENYLRIQQMRFPGRIEYSCEISPEIEDAMIPPFIVQSFVENSIKHAVKLDRHNEIRISGEIIELEEDPFVRICVRDNGEGYDPDVLERIVDGSWEQENTGRHIGINNARKRLELTFGDAAKLRFTNQDGACVEIVIPLTWKEEEDE